VGVVKRRVLRGLWRRLVGVGIIGTGLSGSGLYTVLGRAHLPVAGPALCSVVGCARSWVMGTRESPLGRARGSRLQPSAVRGVPASL
jgi:hypothetical protein